MPNTAKERFLVIFVILTILVLGLSVGAMLGEQKTLVPFWQEISSTDFFAWYGKNAARLKGFFAPLQITAAVLALILAILCGIQKRPGLYWLGSSAFFALAVLSLFFLFFRDTNASFVAKTLTPQQLSTSLTQWASWQWARIALGVAAFLTALPGAFLALKNTPTPNADPTPKTS